MTREEKTAANPVGMIGVSPLRVLVYDTDQAERWLIESLLPRASEDDITNYETDQISEVKIAAERGKVDVVVMDIKGATETYWMEKILEHMPMPVVLLTEDDSDDLSKMCDGTSVVCLAKGSLSRAQLTKAINSALSKSKLLKRGLSHRHELDQIANRDSLTALFNRHTVLSRLEEAMARARRYGEELSLLLLDIDHFMMLNKTFGQVTGDVVLKRIANLLQRRLREADIVGRYGGDEFLAILSHTDADSALVPAERIRKSVEELPISDDGEGMRGVTVSVGVAAYAAGDDVAAFSFRVENCLRTAKQNGRNRVEK